MSDRDFGRDMEWLVTTGVVVTSRYAGFDRASGVPVRSTVGPPRFWRPDRQGELEFAPALAPYELMRAPGKDLPTAQMRVVYRERLEEHEQKIVRQLAEIGQRHPGETLVLLCFEDVNAGEECHRRWFAEWAEDRWGSVIPELPPPAKASKAPAKASKDSDALNAIHALLTGTVWSIDTLDDIAAIVAASGREILPPCEGEE